MSCESFAHKVTAEHLRRDAYLYVRQSSLRQVLENTESTQRQYALRERAVALGWSIERVHTIDSDLGCSGAAAQNRDGFQHLVSQVAMGRRCRVWRATTPTGIACWNSPHWRIR